MESQVSDNAGKSSMQADTQHMSLRVLWQAWASTWQDCGALTKHQMLWHKCSAWQAWRDLKGMHDPASIWLHAQQTHALMTSMQWDWLADCGLVTQAQKTKQKT